MATIVALDAEPRQTCPLERAVVTATTDTGDPGDVVDWFVDDAPVEFTDPATDVNDNVLTIRLRQGEVKVVEARIDGTALTITVEGKVAALRVVYTPEPAGGMHVITAEPAMPQLAMDVVGVGGGVAALSVDVTVGFVANDCPPHGPANLRTLFTVPSAGPGPLDFGDVVVGGGLSTSAEGQVNGCPVRGSGGVGIGGTNPMRAVIRAALPHRVLRAVACRESGLRQFDAPPDGGTARCPLFGPCGEVGVMGIHDPGRDEVWNWRRNVERGIEHFARAVLDARLYPADVRSSPEFAALVAAYNDERLDQGLPVIRVQLSDLAEGDFNEDLRELELDAIRGYDGWTGTDLFGFPLHEFQVAVEDRVGVPVLRVVNVDEVALTGSAVWERVPVTLRPADGCSVPDYVDRVLALLHGCADGVEAPQPPCVVTVVADAGTRSFDPPSTTGRVEITARLRPDVVLPAGGLLRWRATSELTGSVTLDPTETGSLTLTSMMTARHPNRTELTAEVIADGEVRCSRTVEVSVPQFLHVSFLDPDFDLDLTNVGLQVPTSDANQLAVNEAVRDAVREQAFRTFLWLYEGINVRITTAAAAPDLGPENRTRVEVGGRGPAQFGITLQDPGNLVGSQLIKTFSWGFTERSNQVTSDPAYRAVFDGLAVFDPATNQVLAGQPVGPGELIIGPIDPTSPDAARRLNVRAAVLAFGRLLGENIAHECGHALGINHSDLGLMEDGGTRNFTQRTGILSFNPGTGELMVGEPVGFTSVSRATLERLIGTLR